MEPMVGTHPGTQRWYVVPVAAIGVFVLAVLSIRLTPATTVAAWWPASGVTILALVTLRRGPQWSAMLALAGVAVAAANVTGGRGLDTAAGFGIAAVVEAAVVIAVLRSRTAPRPLSLARPTDLVRLLWGTAAGVGAGFVVAALTAFVTEGASLWDVAPYLLTHVSGILLVAPLGFLDGLAPVAWRHRETALQWALTLGATAVVFAPSQPYRLSFALFPLLVWGALRVGVRSMAYQQLALAVLAASLLRIDVILLDRTEDLHEHLVLIQAFLIAAAVIVLPLAVVVDQRQELNRRISESEELFRRSFRESLTGMLMMRREPTTSGRTPLAILDLNATAAEILGGTKPELLGQDWAAMIATDDLSQVVAEMEIGLRSGWTEEVDLVDRRRRVQVALSVLSGGASDGVFVAQMVDVTATHEAALDLRTERDFSAAILSTTASLILVVGVDGLVVGMNRAAETATGFAETEVIGEPVWSSLVPPEEQQTVRSWFTTPTGVPSAHEGSLATRSGGRRQVVWSCSYLRDDRGTPTHAVLTGLDVTGERTTRQLVSHLLEAASATAIIGTDLDAVITVFNRGAEELLGITAAEVLGVATPARFLDDVELETRNASADRMEELLRRLADDADSYTDWTFLTRDGDRRIVALAVNRVRDSLGEQIGYLIVGRDVTELREQNELLESALRKEREVVENMRLLDQAKDDFISTVSHELRTPLTSIVGYTEMLQEGMGGEVAPEQDRLLDIVRRNAERLTTLVEDLLTLSRMEAGSFALERTTLDLREVVVTAQDSLRPLFESRDVAVEFDLPATSVLVTGDRLQLERVILNLVNNAVKFTEDGGAVTCRLTVEPGAEHALLVVSDTGIGIPEADLGQLFTRFFRSANAQERAIQGTGLGLSIVHRIVEAHGGTIAVESQTDVGTTFRVEMPLLGATAVAVRSDVAEA